MDLSSLRYETFRDRVGETFRIADADTSYELVDVEQLPGDSGERAPFALTFLAPDEPAPAQGVKPLVHEELGELPIFLVPIARDDAGIRYHAVFT